MAALTSQWEPPVFTGKTDSLIHSFASANLLCMHDTPFDSFWASHVREKNRNTQGKFRSNERISNKLSPTLNTYMKLVRNWAKATSAGGESASRQTEKSVPKKIQGPFKGILTPDEPGMPDALEWLLWRRDWSSRLYRELRHAA